ncbi:hypothetical protein GCM10023184_21960 [Flaviaesturariibacter amylovorans]|uniref:DUF1648 domain-containing protein n=1 Tax=Flaviaesturariibacter amylovorans TaxID=1084520 RepID=A0ABP8GVZ1_9BACT
MLTLWILVAISYERLPRTIPIHFNALGEADGFGPRFTVWLLLGLLTGIFLLLSAIGRHVHRFPRKSGEGPATEAEYRTLRLFFQWLKLSILLVFAIDIALLFPAVMGNATRQRPWLLPVNIGILLLPTAWLLWTVLRQRRTPA